MLDRLFINNLSPPQRVVPFPMTLNDP